MHPADRYYCRSVPSITVTPGYLERWIFQNPCPTSLSKESVLFCYFHMYGRFADTEVRGGVADGGVVFDDVFRKLTGSILNVGPHIQHSQPLALHQNMPGETVL